MVNFILCVFYHNKKMEKTNMKNNGKVFNFLLNTEPFSNKTTHCDCPRVRQGKAMHKEMPSN